MYWFRVEVSGPGGSLTTSSLAFKTMTVTGEAERQRQRETEKERDRERGRERGKERRRERCYWLWFSFIHFLVLPGESLHLLVAADPGVFETTLSGKAQYIQRGASDRSNGPTYSLASFLKILSIAVDCGCGLYSSICRDCVRFHHGTVFLVG